MMEALVFQFDAYMPTDSREFTFGRGARHPRNFRANAMSRKSCRSNGNGTHVQGRKIGESMERNKCGCGVAKKK